MRLTQEEKREREAQRLLREASFEALRLLTESIGNEELKPELRLKCAENVLERVYGKSAAPEERELRVRFDKTADELSG